MILSLKKERLTDLDKLLFDIYENHHMYKNDNCVVIIFKNKVCIKYNESNDSICLNTYFFMHKHEQFIINFISTYFNIRVSDNNVYYIQEQPL